MTMPDLGSLLRLQQIIAEATAKSVVVGVPANKNGREEGVLGNADVAIIHEMGVPERGIPERSFLRKTMLEKHQNHQELAAKVMRKVLAGDMVVEHALELIGIAAAGDVQETIERGDFAPLSPATIHRKGSSKALIDKGELRQSITSEVRDA
ncbi:hypothetical protein [Laribacter hongkongensis]|uniref:hypothetical protein n=1 Tax=Laribacter hongkongensis TaxID=168471 RepID=UPI0012DF7E9F|nr:hypothetical protein [Laribacter hongkongensis]